MESLESLMGFVRVTTETHSQEFTFGAAYGV